MSGVTPLSVFNVRKAFVTQGLDAALHRKLRDEPPTPRKLDGAGEARLIQIACSKPPEGRSRWTLQLLADRLVELEIVDTISIKTVERTLKKRAPATKKQWGISPAENGNFVAAMEDVLAIYQRPFDPVQPVVCMDEQSIQLHAEVREPIAAQPSRPERHDYEYRRNGVICGFMFTEPLGQWRRITIAETRTKTDWARQIQQPLEMDYPDAEKVILVCDNLNTHVPGALYETFPPEKARNLLSRLEIHHTPKHGSWLNIAEIELSVLTRQCLKRRIPTIEAPRAEAAIWNRKRNQAQKSVDWQFTTSDARMRRKRLYPMILED